MAGFEDHICFPCKAYDREIQVYRPYVHFCFISVFPIGPEQIKMHCRNCGDETRLESIVEKYGRKTKTPAYLYSALILFACVAIFWFYNGTTYSFFRVTGLNGDSVVVFHSNLEYDGFVSSLADDDYFVKDDTLKFARRKIEEMLDRDEIYSVDRGYGKGSGFNRVR